MIRDDVGTFEKNQGDHSPGPIGPHEVCREIMSQTLSRILLVDDDDSNMDVLVECLKEEPYEIVQAIDGEQALELLRNDQQGFHTMVLDRLMPGLSGLDVMAQLKAEEKLQWMPVVMQTSAAAPHEICEGMEAGVFFYLTKPFQRQVLLRIVGAAVQEDLKWKTISRHLITQTHSLGFMQHGRFQVKTMEEAYDLALLLAQACPDPKRVAFGLNELITNAVEHGNLEIAYEGKTLLQASDTWEEEIQRRQRLPQNAHKLVEVLFERRSDQIRVTISDQGQGFDWREYEYLKEERLLESHGRGIAMAKSLSFDHLEYQGVGNQVLCIINLSSSSNGQNGS